MDPYYVFPRELWEKIFDLVENPLDKLNLIRAYPNLQAQCVETEEELLFLSALPMILDNLESSGRQKPIWDRNEERKAFLSCRLVSASSCKVVDKWVESYWEENKGDHEPPSFLLETSFTHYQFLDKFLEDFSNHPETRTPVLSRFALATLPTLDALTFAEDPGHALAMEAEENEERVKFFSKVGSHLRKLKVEFLADCFPHREVMLASLNSIRNMLELTPNLQSLTVDFFSEYDGDQMAATEEQFQFPKLSQSLERLELKWSRHSTVICNPFDSIREYFPQLVELKIRDILHFQDDYLKNAGLFPNLKTLKLGRDACLNKSHSWEGKLRKICREIRAPNLINLEFKYDASWIVDSTHFRVYFQSQFEMLTRHCLFCLNELNKFYSHLEPECQWTGCTKIDRFIKIKLSRKPNTD